MTFSRRIHRLTTVAIVVAYLLGTTFGGVLHDHSHGCEAHGHGVANTAQHADTGHSHGHHHHGGKLAHAAHGHCHQHHAAAEQPADENHSNPLYDDDCGICRLLGQAPLATPTVELAITIEVVATFIESDVAPPSVSPPRLNLSRAPPAIG